jgi:hypothetical protein
MMTTAVKIICADMRKVAGGSVFGSVPKVDWEGNVPVVRKNEPVPKLLNPLREVQRRFLR